MTDVLLLMSWEVRTFDLIAEHAQRLDEHVRADIASAEQRYAEELTADSNMRSRAHDEHEELISPYRRTDSAPPTDVQQKLDLPTAIFAEPPDSYFDLEHLEDQLRVLRNALFLAAYSHFEHVFFSICRSEAGAPR